jgi:hypothetical protein
VSTISSVPKGIWDFLNHAGEALKQATVCQTNDGVVVVPIQWDYVAWTPMTKRFITALKGPKIHHPGFQLQRNPYRRRLTHDRTGPRRARRESHDQSAPRPAAMKQPVHGSVHL